MERKNIIIITIVAVLIIAAAAIALVYYLNSPEPIQPVNQESSASSQGNSQAVDKSGCPKACKIQNIVCGADGKDYCNKCQAKAAGTTVASEGSCNKGGNPEPLIQNIGGETSDHGCVGAAGYVWCAAKNKCLRPWVETCQ